MDHFAKSLLLAQMLSTPPLSSSELSYERISSPVTADALPLSVLTRSRLPHSPLVQMLFSIVNNGSTAPPKVVMGRHPTRFWPPAYAFVLEHIDIGLCDYLSFSGERELPEWVAFSLTLQALQAIKFLGDNGLIIAPLKREMFGLVTAYGHPLLKLMALDSCVQGDMSLYQSSIGRFALELLRACCPTSISPGMRGYSTYLEMLVAGRHTLDQVCTILERRLERTRPVPSSFCPKLLVLPDSREMTPQFTCAHLTAGLSVGNVARFAAAAAGLESTPTACTGLALAESLEYPGAYCFVRSRPPQPLRAWTPPLSMDAEDGPRVDWAASVSPPEFALPLLPPARSHSAAAVDFVAVPAADPVPSSSSSEGSNMAGARASWVSAPEFFATAAPLPTSGTPPNRPSSGGTGATSSRRSTLSDESDVVSDLRDVLASVASSRGACPSPTVKRLFQVLGLINRSTFGQQGDEGNQLIISNRQQLHRKGVVPALLDVISLDITEHATAVETSLQCMSNLCQDGDVRASFLSSGGIPIVLKCMADSLPSSEETLVKASRCLEAACRFNREAAIQFLDTPDSTAVLVGIIRRFPDRSFLVDKVCALINSLFRVDKRLAAAQLVAAGAREAFPPAIRAQASLDSRLSSRLQTILQEKMRA